MADDEYCDTGAYGSGPSGPSNPNWGRTDTSYSSGAAVGNTDAWGSLPSPFYTPAPGPTSVSSRTVSYFGANSGDDSSGVAGGGGCSVTTAPYDSPHHPMWRDFEDCATRS